MKKKILLLIFLIFFCPIYSVFALDPPSVWGECKQLDSDSDEYRDKNCEQVLKNFEQEQRDWIEHTSKPTEERFTGIISEIIIDNPMYESGGMSPLETKVKIDLKWITLDFSKQKNIKTGTITKNGNVVKLLGEYPENLSVGDKVEVFAHRRYINSYTIVHDNNYNNSEKYYIKILDKKEITKNQVQIATEPNANIFQKLWNWIINLFK